MKARFYANMRTVIGMSSLEMDITLDTPRKLVTFLVAKYPDAKFQLLDEQDNLRSDVPIYVDGRNPRLLKDGIDTLLQADSIVSLFSPIASGRINVEVLREPTLRKRSDR